MRLIFRAAFLVFAMIFSNQSFGATPQNELAPPPTGAGLIPTLEEQPPAVAHVHSHTSTRQSPTSVASAACCCCNPLIAIPLGLTLLGVGIFIVSGLPNIYRIPIIGLGVGGIFYLIGTVAGCAGCAWCTCGICVCCGWCCFSQTLAKSPRFIKKPTLRMLTWAHGKAKIDGMQQRYLAAPASIGAAAPIAPEAPTIGGVI